MNTPESQVIVNRFFEAIQILIDAGAIGGLQTFTNRYGLNYRNVFTLKKAPSRQIFQPAWLTALVEDYGFSPRWLLTGKGAPIPAQKLKRLQSKAGTGKRRGTSLKQSQNTI